METGMDKVNDEKSLMQTLIDYIQEDVPDHLNTWPYTLGAIPLVLFTILALTGILMTFYYMPLPGRAYASVNDITNNIFLGWFIRGMHKQTVNLMLLFMAFHILRVFLLRGYRENGAAKWLLGSALLFTTLAFGFTGYSLVYDNVSYWGMIVVTNMLGELPFVGKPILYLLRGGEHVSDITLLRLYDLHTKLLPLLIAGLIGAHVIAIRLLGFARIEDDQGVHDFYPDHAMKMAVISIGLLILIVNLTIIFPPTLGEIANPQQVAQDVSPPWYFAATYRWITIAPRQPAMFGLFFISLLFVIYPFIDRFLERRGVRMDKVNMVVGVVAIIIFTTLTVWQTVASYLRL